MSAVVEPKKAAVKRKPESEKKASKPKKPKTEKKEKKDGEKKEKKEKKPMTAAVAASHIVKLAMSEAPAAATEKDRVAMFKVRVMPILLDLEVAGYNRGAASGKAGKAPG